MPEADNMSTGFGSGYSHLAGYDLVRPPTMPISSTGLVWAPKDARSGAARVDPLDGLGDRHRLGLVFNDMVASGESKAPAAWARQLCMRSPTLAKERRICV